MNAKRRLRLKAKFAPEARFELKPLARSTVETLRTQELDQLKAQLLGTVLEQTENLALRDPLKRAANEAAAIAWLTAYPLLVFPTLFEEKTREARRQADRQQQILAASEVLFEGAA